VKKSIAPIIKGACIAIIASSIGYDISMNEWWGIVIPMNIILNI